MATSGSYEPVKQAKIGEHELSSSKPTERPWRPGMLRQLPWTGLLALLLGFGCGVAALAIALVSDDKPLDYWRVYSHSVQPTVLLAILVTVANALLGYAFASGTAIFWWTSALAGRTLRRLHASQSRGDSLMAALALRPVFNAVTVASVFTSLLLMDQPLFQRGIRVVTRPSKDSKNMSIPLSSSPIQLGATGIVPDHSDYTRPELFHPLYAQVVRQYQNRDPIQFALPECKGRCDFDIISTGWEVDCTEWETPYRLMDYADYQMYYPSLYDNGSRYSGPAETQPVFSVNITYGPGEYDSSSPDDPFHPFHIGTSVMYKATAGANGTMRWRNCTLTEALTKYPVEVSNNTLRLKAMSPGINRTVHRILRNPEVSGQYDYPSTLGGIWKALDFQFAAQANVTFVAAWTRIGTQDMGSNTYLQISSNSTLDSIDYNATWSDPTDDMISMTHELTLRAAIATTNKIVVTSTSGYRPETIPNVLTQGQPEIQSPNLTLVNRTLDQTAEVAMTFDETVYKIHPQWLAGAFAVIVVAGLSIVPTYWGWWNLGRPVSMSPLEIARAFDAPLMQHADPNGTVCEHLRTVGDMRVRYGYHATVAEQTRSDTTERPSHLPRIEKTFDTFAVELRSSDDGPYSANGSAPNMLMVGPARPDDDIELQMLHPEANPTSRTRSDRETTRRSVASSDPFESDPKMQVDLSSSRVLGPEAAPSRIHSRTEMMLRFAEE